MVTVEIKTRFDEYIEENKQLFYKVRCELHGHCMHESKVQLLSNPANIIKSCCWCMYSRKEILSQPIVDGDKHGPHFKGGL